MANTRILDLNPYSGGTTSDVLPIENLTANKTEKISLQEIYDSYSGSTTISYFFVMPKKSSGEIIIPPDSNAFIFGSDFDISGATITVGSGSTLYVFDPSEYKLDNNNLQNIQEFTDNSDAISNGLDIGDLYRTGDFLKIVH